MPEPMDNPLKSLLLVPGDSLSVCPVYNRCSYSVAHVNSPDDFYLTRCDSHILTKISQSIKFCFPYCVKPYNKAILDKINQPGVLCLALSGSSGEYRRAVFKRATKDGDGFACCLVHFIDYGNEELVMSKDRRLLLNFWEGADPKYNLSKEKREQIATDMQFLRFCPAQAIRCSLKGIERFSGQDYNTDASQIGGTRRFSLEIMELFQDFVHGQGCYLKSVEPNSIEVRKMMKDPNYNFSDTVFKVDMDIIDNEKQRNVLALLRAKFKRSDMYTVQKPDFHEGGDTVLPEVPRSPSKLNNLKLNKDVSDDASSLGSVEEETIQHMLNPNITDYLLPKGGIHVWVSHKVSLEEFYIHPIRPIRCDDSLDLVEQKMTSAMALQILETSDETGKGLSQLSHDLDQIYFNPENRAPLMKHVVQTLWDNGHRVYAATLRGEGTPHCGSEWRRVEVTRPYYEDSIGDEDYVRVNYIDWGGSDLKGYNDIYRLHESLVATPAQAWRCCMQHQQYSEDRLRRFKYFLRTDVPLIAYAIEWEKVDTNTAFTVNILDVDIPLDGGKTETILTLI